MKTLKIIPSLFSYKKRLFLFFPLLIIVFISVEFILNVTGRTIKSLPSSEFNSRIDNLYADLSNNRKQIDWKLLEGDLEYINRQLDVADFRLAILVRIMLEHPGVMPPELMEKCKQTLLTFRYWMDEPGENGMCYWSENHQILFASSEYLAGLMYPDAVFTNSGLTGRQHMEKAKKRIYDWLEMRWKFGFSEFYSNVYYNEDIAGLINLIDYSDDSLMVERAKIVTDILFYDIASQKTGGMFVSVSGRLYERHRKGGPHLSSAKAINYVWNNTLPESPHINYVIITSKKYSVPRVLVEIGRDTMNAVIKQCNGLNIEQLKPEGYFGSDERSIMMQWGMEAFSNPAIVRNSFEYIRRNKLFTNEFLSDFRYFNSSLLRLTGSEGLISEILNPMENGTAILQANTYTYRTKNYSLYSAQNYSPGNYSCQVHVNGMNIDSSFSVFHTHPAKYSKTDKTSPGYWVGYGRLPHVAQDSSVSLAIYSIPALKNITEKELPDFTHAYFPAKKFDSVFIEGQFAFGAKGNTYCALAGFNQLFYTDTLKEDLIQKGKKVFWIIEAGDRSKDGSFYNFRRRIKENKIYFDNDNLVLKYISRNNEYKLKFGEDFYINNTKAINRYPRYDSPYIKAGYKPAEMSFNFNGYFLKLNFEKGGRIFN